MMCLMLGVFGKEVISFTIVVLILGVFWQEVMLICPNHVVATFWFGLPLVLICLSKGHPNNLSMLGHAGFWFGLPLVLICLSKGHPNNLSMLGHVGF